MKIHFHRRIITGTGGSSPADGVDLAFQPGRTETADGKHHQQLDRGFDLIIDAGEDGTPFGAGAAKRRRVRESSVRRQRMAGPHRTGFFRRPVADRDDEVHGGAIPAGEFFPALAHEPLGPVAQRLKKRPGLGMDIPGRPTAGAEGAKAPLAQSVENGLGHDAAGRVAGADEKYVFGPCGHDRPFR